MKKHYGPMQISIFADGYTTASLTSCGVLDGMDSEYLDDLGHKMTLDPTEVTCAACKRTRGFRDALATYESTGKLPLLEANVVPRMRNSVYKNGGTYDIARNNRLRAFLKMDPVYPDPEKIRGIYENEQKIRAEYSKRRG